MSSAGRTNWIHVIAPAIGLVAGVTFVAGVYLLDPGAIDLGLALDSKRTWLVGAFLIGAGSALAFKLARPDGPNTGSLVIDLLVTPTLGNLSHFVWGAISVVLGAEALLARPPVNDWVALLLVPGLLSLVIAFSNDRSSTQAAKDEREKGGDDAFANYGDRPFFDVVWPSLQVGGIFAAYIFAMGTVAALGFALYKCLRAVIFQAATVDGATLAATALDTIGDALPSIARFVLTIGAGMAAFVFVILLSGWLWQKLKKAFS